MASTNSFQHSDCMQKGERLGENIACKWSSSGGDYSGDNMSPRVSNYPVISSWGRGPIPQSNFFRIGKPENCSYNVWSTQNKNPIVYYSGHNITLLHRNFCTVSRFLSFHDYPVLLKALVTRFHCKNILIHNKKQNGLTYFPWYFNR